MNQKEILLYLAEHLDIFENITWADFNLLFNMEYNEYGQMTPKNYQITPLLSQICRYALIPSIVEDDKMKELATIPRDAMDMLDYSCIFKIVSYCCHFISDLIENGAYHPSIHNLLCLENGKYLYDTMMDTICEIIYITRDAFQDHLIDDSNFLDENILKIMDTDWDYLMQKLEYGQTNKKKILSELTKYAEKVMYLYNLITPVKNNKSIPYIGNCYIQVVKEKIDTITEFSIGAASNKMFDILSNMENHLKEFPNWEVVKLIMNVQEAAELYHSYRYQYLKGRYQEEKMIQKCQKM